MTIGLMNTIQKTKPLKIIVMKKVVILSLLLTFTVTSFCQQTVPNQTTAQTNYLQKSKKQKKVGWVLIAGGAASIVTSIVIPQDGNTGLQIDPLGGIYEGHKNDGIKGAFGLTGVVAMLGSIPFFIASGKNKRRAMNVSGFLQMEKAPVLHTTGLATQRFPALAVRLQLR
jgi:hypothetical protein